MVFWQRKQKKLDNEDDTPRAGFDNPLSNPQYDLLDRKAVTNHVYAYLTQLDPKWSVRVGLIASWGEGKTTIGEWIAERALKEGHVPVWWRDPWTASTDAELWLGFYKALTTALKSQEIEFEGSVKQTLASISGSDIAKKASETHNYAQAGLGFVQALTRITSEDIDKIKAALGEKRVIVIIDDLDRVDAALIPRLLMSLRGVMDVEGFSFLIPFDERVVSEALSKHIQAEGYGERFLEKILDFRVYLASASERQVAAFFYSELRRHCPFISTDVLEGLDEYLPGNPRKLKSLVRGLKLYQSEAGRHGPEEIDWKAVIFIQMIRMESEPFFQIFKEDTFGKNENLNPENMSASNPWMHAGMEKDDNKAKNREKERLESLLTRAGIEVPEIKDRLVKVCEGWRICQGFWNLDKIFYALRLLDMPEALTWTEFDDFWKIWSQTKTLSDLTPWISEHAQKMEKSQAEIACELTKTLIQQYGFHLDRAAQASLQSQHIACIKDAETVLELLDKLVDESFPTIPQDELLTVDIFERLFSVCCKWAHFTVNAADKNLRAKEFFILQKWIQKVNQNWDTVPYAVFIKKSRRSNIHQKEAMKLIDDIFAELDLDSNDRVIEIFQTEEGIARLFPYEAGSGIKDRLLDVKSGLWNPKEKSPALKALSTAAENPVIQLNARDFLDLLQNATNEGTWGLGRADIKEFYKHPDLIGKIWEAATVTPYQFRSLSHMRDIRKNLISKDVGEEYLPMPEWLTIKKDNDVEDTPGEMQAAE